MTHFWAKTTSEDKPGISVYDHMVNVGCVARGLAETCPEILNTRPEIPRLLSLGMNGRPERASESWRSGGIFGIVCRC